MKYQVEYMSRPDEREHVEPFGRDRRKACDFARRMSHSHDGSAYVVAIDEETEAATGHIVYVFGVRSDVEGTVK